MAVGTVKSTAGIGYGAATSARPSGAVRDAAYSQASQINELQGSQLTGTRAEASTPDGYEGLGQLAGRQPAATIRSQVPSFGMMGLAPMAYFAQERAESQPASQQTSLSRNLGPNAAGRGADTYESAKRTIEGGPEASYRYS